MCRQSHGQQDIAEEHAQEPFLSKDAYISVDFLKKSTEVVRLKEVEGTPDPLAVLIELGENKGTKQIYFENPKVDESNAIREELHTFAQAIHQDKEPEVTIEDGYEALSIAHQIADKLKLLPSIA